MKMEIAKQVLIIFFLSGSLVITGTAISLSQQLEYFEEFIERLKLAKGHSVADEIISEALYIFSIGTNDFILNYFALPIRRAQYTTLEYVAYLIGLADAAVRDAYRLGARKIGFTGLGPFGCIPAERTLNLDETGGCNEEYNQVAMRFNAELQDAVRKLNRGLAGAQVVYADTYSVLSTIVANPSDYGFDENVAQGCCGTGRIETSVLCGLEEPLTCQDPNKYLFFDSAHPSERACKIIANDILNSALRVFL
ncbi:hypothetical protein SETIT_3G237900v2 [Setaria italica]|uniref:Uncharacterized protein n=1 Tax=Setaria italica TaxID=4555 RepID=A0A368QI61_SETIT|nr:hypothetical protein SETIT_3G237900v2 [Setaria italica]